MTRLVSELGTKQWGAIGNRLGGRTGKQVCAWVGAGLGLGRGDMCPFIHPIVIYATHTQCRERWHNQLDPTIRKDPWSPEEEQRLQVCGRGWVGLVAGHWDLSLVSVVGRW